MSRLAELVAQLGERGGVPDVRLDEARSCSLVFDEQTVHLEEHEGGDAVLLYADVGRLPPVRADADALCRSLLEANLFTAGTAGATLGVAFDSGLVALTLRIDLRACDYAEFEARLERYVDAMFAWRDRLEGQQAVEPPMAAPSSGYA